MDDPAWWGDLGQKLLLAAFGASLSFIVAQYWWNKSRNSAEAKDLADTLKAMSTEISLLKTQAAIAAQQLMPISTAMQASLVRQLTHDHRPLLDVLLEKIDPFTLTEEEEILLYQMLEDRARDMSPEINASERNAARMLPFVMKRVKEEDDTKGKVGLQTVVVPIKVDPMAVDQSGAPAEVSTVHNDPSADPADPVRREEDKVR